MALPIDFIIIRHGQSEANTQQKEPRDEGGDNSTQLTREGIEQAKATGDWLRSIGLTGFDRYYTSSYMRARQTAALLALMVHGLSTIVGASETLERLLRMLIASNSTSGIGAQMMANRWQLTCASDLRALWTHCNKRHLTGESLPQLTVSL